MKAIPILNDADLHRCMPKDEEAGFGALRTARGPLPLRNLAVDALIDGLLAQVTVTQTFVNVLDALTNAIFVGEPTGSRANFAGEGGFLLLPCHPELRANISTAYHQGTMWEDHRLWIAPDVPVSLSSADYFAGKDPVLNAVVDLIQMR